MSALFDVNKWTLQLLPPVLRRPVLYALFKSCLDPLKDLRDSYATYVDLVNQKLAQISYTASLAAWLNSIFYLPDGTIYIEDSIDRDVYLFTQGEVPEVTYLFTRTEEIPLYLELEPGEKFDGFIIRIPRALNTEDNLRIIQKWINYYKIAGVNYKIAEYE